MLAAVAMMKHGGGSRLIGFGGRLRSAEYWPGSAVACGVDF
jgi:hypothetical protein